MRSLGGHIVKDFIRILSEVFNLGKSWSNLLRSFPIVKGNCVMHWVFGVKSMFCRHRTSIATSPNIETISLVNMSLNPGWTSHPLPNQLILRIYYYILNEVLSGYSNSMGVSSCDDVLPQYDSVFGKRVLTYWKNRETPDYSQMNGFMVWMGKWRYKVGP